MVLLVGQVARHMMEREAFQEVDYRRMFGPMAKWVGQIDDARRIPEFVARAFQTATSGRPGPVVLALPEDMLTDPVDVAVVPRPSQRVQATPAAADLRRLLGLLAAAERPIAILGGTVWTPDAVLQFQKFAQAHDLPVACAFRFQDLFDNGHSNYVGDVGLGIRASLAQRIRESDLVLAIGARLGEATTGGYTLLDVPYPRQALVHVHAGAEELGRVYQADLMINAGMPEFAAALQASLPDGEPGARPSRAAWLREARAEYLAWTQRQPMPGRLQLWDVLDWLQGQVPDDTIITNGAGNYTVWLHRFWRHRRFRTQLAPTSGAMGYGVPAAIAAKLACPQRTVLAFAGDGCFLMNGQELATAVQYRAGVIFIVINNGMYGTIRMHQEREYPGHVMATDLVNPDFAALARAYGLHGETVEDTAAFAGAFRRCQASGGPALIELRVDPEGSTPTATLDGLRQQALVRQTTLAVA